MGLFQREPEPGAGSWWKKGAGYTTQKYWVTNKMSPFHPLDAKIVVLIVLSLFFSSKKIETEDGSKGEYKRWQF